MEARYAQLRNVLGHNFLIGEHGAAGGYTRNQQKEKMTFHATPVLILGMLKEQCHEVFVSGFFHKTTFPGPNRHAQERFRIFSNICGVIRIRIRLPGNEYNGESISIL
jgi:hypothetical protein